MNEITKIHLGRQAFVIANDAHAVLEEYLRAIEAAVGKKGKEVTEEVELRMAELLAERKIGPEKVILLKDVAYLKEQLGSPKDFAEDEEQAEEAEKPAKSVKEKRLFRDTEHGMIAGVAAGLGNYLGVDAVWLRLAFVLGLFTGAWGLIAYVILWLIVPEAKTTSEKLQMRGKAVTVDNLKAVVDKADVPGVAKRAGSTFGRALNTILKIMLVLLGVGIVAGGVSLVFGLLSAAAFLVFGGAASIAGGLFPVGAAETLLVVLGFIGAASFALLIVFAGLAIAKRKWPLPVWVTALLVGAVFLCLSIGSAFTATVAPRVQDRYEALAQTSTTQVQPFSALEVIGDQNTQFRFVPASTTSVRVTYRGPADTTKLNIATSDQKLTVNALEFAKSLRCKNICLFHDPTVEVIIYGPSIKSASVSGEYMPRLQIEGLKDQSIELQSNGVIDFVNIVADKIAVKKGRQGAWTIAVSGGSKTESIQPLLHLQETHGTVSGRQVELVFDDQCSPGSSRFYVSEYETLTANGKQIESPEALIALQDEFKNNFYNCVYVGGGYYYYR